MSLTSGPPQCAGAMESPVAAVPRALGESVAKGKRAAVVVFSYYPSDPRVMRSAQAMRRTGFAVDLLCLQKNRGEPRKECVNGVEVFRIPLQKRRSSKLAYAFQYLTFLILSFFWLSSRQLSRRYDVVHVHNMPDFLVFCAAFAKAMGARVVLDLHDPTPEVFISVYDLSPDHWLVSLLRWVEKISIKFADLVLTPNIAFRNLFVSRSCPANKIQIVMNTPLEEIFPLQESTDGARGDRNAKSGFIVMYHGTLIERHGLHTAVEAIARLRDRIPGLRLHIYGAETAYLRDQVLPLVAKLKLQEQVNYLGEQPLKVIAHAVAECDLGVVPNLRTVFTEINLPTRIFEYLALGKPVIVPDTQGIRDYFDTKDMLFFNGGEVEGLVRQIQWVFDNPQETRALVRAGQKVYRQHLWKQEEQRLTALMCGLVR